MEYLKVPAVRCVTDNRYQPWRTVPLLTLYFSPAAYLHSLLSNHISGSTATLRSVSRPLLHVPRTPTVYGSRAFSVAAPTLWNSLPADITNAASLTAFRNSLASKHFYFTSWLVPPSSASESSDLMALYKLVFNFNFNGVVNMSIF